MEFSVVEWYGVGLEIQCVQDLGAGSNPGRAFFISELGNLFKRRLKCNDHQQVAMTNFEKSQL